MSFLYKLPSGLWRAQIARLGTRKSMTFNTKTEAKAWADRIENELLSAKRGTIPDKTVGDLIERYKLEEAPHKKGAKWEKVRCDALKRSRIAQVRCKYLDATHLSGWQQERLKSVSSASVRRERALLNAILNLAVREWGWLKFNPFPAVRKPADSKPRDRVPTQDELDRLMQRASPEMKRVITVAVETGMRAGEIAKLRDIRGRVAFLTDTKNGDSRMVALSTKAALELEVGPIQITAGSISAQWAEYCRELEIKGLHFHDLRRFAATKMAQKLTPMELAKQLGHRDLKMTLNTYYRMDPLAVAEKLG